MTALTHYKTIFMLGLPIIAGMLSQSLLNLVDAALVGQLGTSSLAGVGIGGYANFVAVSLILGISSSVQMLVARNANKSASYNQLAPIFSGFAFSLCIALPLSLICILGSGWFIALLNSEPAIQDIAESYFDYRTAGMMAMALLLTCRGWWNGTQSPGNYLRVLLITHLLNVVISYCLIFGYLGLPRMGAPGAGLGTAIALYIGVFTNLWQIGSKHAFRTRLNLSALIEQIQLVRLVKLSIPHSAQQFLFALSICVLIWTIGKLGTQDQAIAYLLINISLFLILPAVGFGIASTSLVSQAIGDSDFQSAKQWGWRVILVASVSILVLSLPLLFLPSYVLSIFVSLPEIIEIASPLLQLTALAILIDASAIVLSQSLYGANAGKHAFIITTFGQWIFYLPMAWFVGVYLNYGLMGIWLVQLVHRSMSAGLFILIWKQQRWKYSHNNS